MRGSSPTARPAAAADSPGRAGSTSTHGRHGSDRADDDAHLVRL